MRPFFSAFLAILAIGIPAHGQQEAFEGTLGDYLSLDDEGVRIGRTVFSDFQLLPLQEGTQALAPGGIRVVPLFEDALTPGFRFDIMDGATGEDFFELHFTFRVSGSVFDGASVSLSDVSALGNGGSDLVVDVRPAGESNPLATLIAFATPEAGADTDVSENFAESTALDIEFDVVIDGGMDGREGEIRTSLGSTSLNIDQVISDQPVTPFVTRTGITDSGNFFIEFLATPSAPYMVMASTTLADGFPENVSLSQGDGTTGADGFERVEITIDPEIEERFFRIELAS